MLVNLLGDFDVISERLAFQILFLLFPLQSGLLLGFYDLFNLLEVLSELLLQIVRLEDDDRWLEALVDIASSHRLWQHDDCRVTFLWEAINAGMIALEEITEIVLENRSRCLNRQVKLDSRFRKVHMQCQLLYGRHEVCEFILFKLGLKIIFDVRIIEEIRASSLE